jgi:hypothetical protein
MVERGNIDYLCCDHLAELTMSILNKQKQGKPDRGYTRDFLQLMGMVLPQCKAKGIKVISNAGGANPAALVDQVVKLAQRLGVTGLKVACVTGDDILNSIDRLEANGADFRNMETGEPLSKVRDRLTHANVYIGCDGIVEALANGADMVICGRVTDIALYLGPMRHELGWAADDWQKLGIGTAAAHCVECGGQGTGGLFAGGWQRIPNLAEIGYPIAEIYENGDVILGKTPDSGGEVSAATVSEQLLYEILDPGNYLTADATADITNVALEEIGPDRVRMQNVAGKPRPETLKVNMGYRAGFVGEATWSYTWPDAYEKAKAAVSLLEQRLDMVDFTAEERRVEYVGHNSMWGSRVPEPDDPEALEITIRYAARCPTLEEAEKVYTEMVPLCNNGPAGHGGITTRPAIKELFALWPCLIPRDAIDIRVAYTVT